MQSIKQNNQLYNIFNSDQKFDIFYNIQNNNTNLISEKIKNILGPLELITNPGKVKTFLGARRSNGNDFVWIKITNSFEDDINSFCFHHYKGFYISITGIQNTLLIQYNDPIEHYVLNNIINFFNKIQYVKHFDYVINIVEKIVKRKCDFLDYN
jgi:hypothetical protein